jgi:glycerol transport system ATP-binding protein
MTSSIPHPAESHEKSWGPRGTAGVTFAGLLEFAGVSKAFGLTPAVKDVSFKLQPGEIACLLGPSGCGKTTLLRIAAGIEKPDSGSLLFDGQVMAGKGIFVPPEKRSIGLMFQDFALFPHLTILDNVAFGLKNLPRSEARRVAQHALERVDLAHYAGSYPHHLSGGEQQRVALARALVKGAPLMLLDEPLVNLDYKLREELREELSALFSTGDSTVVYATTEPTEALLLGGYTAVMDAGEVLQYGPTAEVFHKPKSIRVARAFSDPPMNLVEAKAASLGVQLSSGLQLQVPLHGHFDNGLTVGVRASALRVVQRPGDVALPGKVELAEISGSDTFVHVDTEAGELVALLTGVHYFDLGAPITLYLDPAQAYVFDPKGNLLVAPVGRER